MSQRCVAENLKYWSAVEVVRFIVEHSYQVGIRREWERYPLAYCSVQMSDKDRRSEVALYRYGCSRWQEAEQLSDLRTFLLMS